MPPTHAPTPTIIADDGRGLFAWIFAHRRWPERPGGDCGGLELRRLGSVRRLVGALLDVAWHEHLAAVAGLGRRLGEACRCTVCEIATRRKAVVVAHAKAFAAARATEVAEAGLAAEAVVAAALVEATTATKSAAARRAEFAVTR